MTAKLPSTVPASFLSSPDAVGSNGDWHWRTGWLFVRDGSYAKQVGVADFERKQLLTSDRWWFSVRQDFEKAVKALGWELVNTTDMLATDDEVTQEYWLGVERQFQVAKASKWMRQAFDRQKEMYLAWCKARAITPDPRLVEMDQYIITRRVKNELKKATQI